MPWTAPLRGVCSSGLPWITESSSSFPGDGGLAPSMNRQRGTKQPARKQYAYTRGCRVQSGLASYSLHPRAGRPRVVGGARRGGALPSARGKRASLPPGAKAFPAVSSGQRRLPLGQFKQSLAVQVQKSHLTLTVASCTTFLPRGAAAAGFHCRAARLSLRLPGGARRLKAFLSRFYSR